MTLKAIVCVNLVALLVAIPMFVEGTFHPSPVRSLKDPKIVFNACFVRDYSEDPQYSTLYSIYSVLRALLINVGPCTVLVILNAILVERMKEAKQNRQRLIKKRLLDSRAQDQTSVTLMLVGISGFCVISIPQRISFFLGDCRDDISHRGNTDGASFDHLRSAKYVEIRFYVVISPFFRSTAELRCFTIVSN